MMEEDAGKTAGQWTPCAAEGKGRVMKAPGA